MLVREATLLVSASDKEHGCSVGCCATDNADTDSHGRWPDRHVIVYTTADGRTGLDVP